jgi:serine protease Do
MKAKIFKPKYIELVLVILMAILAGAGCALHGGASSSDTAIVPIQRTVSELDSNSNPATSSLLETVGTLPDFSKLIATVRPSVVAISTETTISSRFGRAFTQEGAGSGWIIDANGLIVTNSHVVQDAASVVITLEDGRIFEAQSIQADETADLALIKIEASNLPALSTGDSTTLKVGEWVVALGNSMGLGISATKGIVSALDVTLSDTASDTMNDLIQTDAAINPGNSGGPLLNLAGKVVGINSAKVAEVGVEGMGYAISMEEALSVIVKLRSQIT